MEGKIVKLVDNKGDILINEGEEGFLVAVGNGLRTLPTGLHRRNADCGALVFRCDATYEGVAGVGEGRGARGWFSFRCTLLSPRRFAGRFSKALMEGAQAETLLTQLARETFAETLRSTTSGIARLWLTCKQNLEQALLDCGWQMAEFHPECIEREREAWP